MDLADLKGLGPTRINRLSAMGITSLRDLLYFFPIRYEDHVHVTPLSEAWEGNVLVEGVVPEKPKISYFQGRSRVSARLQGAGSSLPLCWFNEPWMVQQLPVGAPIRLYGHLQVKDRLRTLQNPKIVTKEGWQPVYRPIRGMPGKLIQQAVGEALSMAGEICPETLPASFRNRYHLLPLQEALRQCHTPESMERLADAVRRLDFENMLMYLMGVALFQQQHQPGFPLSIPEDGPENFWSKMPFPPTGAQRRVLEEIAADLRKEEAMSRLVQGDVGCGKTILAFGAICLSWGQGYQSAMMAPTEVLARQHFENAQAQLSPLGLHCELLTGSTRAAERRRILKALKEGICDAVFGTHALISEGVEYAKLGLVVTDEQHRFGVRQRSSLQEKGKDPDLRVPHVLVMSATPIPRTLALILYGDLDLSLVDELPPGRKPVRTRLVPEEKRGAMYAFLREQVAKGQQAYVVCPLVEDSETLEGVRSAQALYQELTTGPLKDLRLGRTWGSQKSEEKAETLRAFAAGELDVLVATTVIEVGVNVPNATVMIIENAERYGLSQLHQLRGRVGRGEAESWCFLLSGATKKLRVLCETNDGFEVARKDLELRGPGDLMGTRQSGEAAKSLTGVSNLMLLDEVQRCVRELMAEEALAPEREQIERLTRSVLSKADFQIARN